MVENKGDGSDNINNDGGCSGGDNGCKKSSRGGTRIWKLGVQSNKNCINELNSVI